MHEPPLPASPEAGLAAALAFDPVPTAHARHDGWTPRRQRDFISALAAMGVVSRACKAVGLTVQSAYKLRQRAGAESFAAAWDVALDIGYSENFALAMERATKGIEVPRFYRGKQVGTVRRLDYRLALAAIAEPPAWPAPPRKKVSG